MGDAHPAAFPPCFGSAAGRCCLQQKVQPALLSLLSFPLCSFLSCPAGKPRYCCPVKHIVGILLPLASSIWILNRSIPFTFQITPDVPFSLLQSILNILKAITYKPMLHALIQNAGLKKVIRARDRTSLTVQRGR